MWAQSWINLENLVKPYPEASEVDITAALIAKNYTVLKMFDVADEFYTSLGLASNGVSYNTSLGAMIEKPTDGREVLCHASAWDFCDKKTFRSVYIFLFRVCRLMHGVSYCIQGLAHNLSGHF